ncbi:MAG: protein-methionine-sulfoxide reductase heme-binding subunit MsrQ [Vicinamibacteria bacterium]
MAEPQGAFAKLRAWREPKGFGVVLILLAITPAIYAIYGVTSDITRGTRILGSNPVKEVEHFLGGWTLRFLVATLMVTPLRQILKWNWLAKQRRTLGLFAFAYGTLHWLAYIFLDVQLDWQEIVVDVTKRPYILIGSAALLLMVPLAMTSTKKMIARLGGKWWNRLHKLVYVSAILGVIHFWMSVKLDVSRPLLFAVTFAVLFAYRIWKWRQRVSASARA